MEKKLPQEIIIHIGLGKTGSSYLQRKCFVLLDKANFLYNPPIIVNELMKHIEVRQFDSTALAKSKNFIDLELDKNPGKTLFISHEGITTDVWKVSYDIPIKVVKYLFPEAKIILALRHQISWCVSCYKQAINQNKISTFKEFLNFKDGEFRSDGDKEFQTDIHLLDYPSIIEACTNAYSKEHLYVYFFEDFKKDNKKTVQQIMDFLGTSIPDVDNVPENRSLSAFSNSLIILYQKLFNLFGVNIPYLYKEKNSTPFQMLAHIPIKKAWKNKNILKLIPIVLSKTKVRIEYNFFSWVGLRLFFEKYIDNVFYLDWRPYYTRRMHDKVEKIYLEKNKRLTSLLPNVKIPNIYIQRTTHLK